MISSRLLLKPYDAILKIAIVGLVHNRSHIAIAYPGFGYSWIISMEHTWLLQVHLYLACTCK